MSCERFSAAVEEYACAYGLGGGPLPAAGSALQPDVTDHLRACARCRESLEAQQRMLASADAEIARALALEASPDFAARVMARVEAQRPASRGTAWWQVAAAAAIAGATYFAWPADPARQPDVPTRTEAPSTQSAPPPQIPVGTPSPQPTRDVAPREPGRPERRHASARSSAPGTGPLSLEVIVPESQTRAVARVMELTRRGVVAEEAVVAEAPDTLRIQPLAIPELVVETIRAGGPQ